MSPSRPVAPVDKQTDIWPRVLFEMLVGRAQFNGERSRHTSEDPEREPDWQAPAASTPAKR